MKRFKLTATSSLGNRFHLKKDRYQIICLVCKQDIVSPGAKFVQIH